VFFAFNPCPGQNQKRNAQKFLDKNLKQFKVFLCIGEMENSGLGLTPIDTKGISGAWEKRSMKLKRRPEFV
jgi:hypothetical protein